MLNELVNDSAAAMFSKLMKTYLVSQLIEEKSILSYLNAKKEHMIGAEVIKGSIESINAVIPCILFYNTERN